MNRDLKWQKKSGRGACLCGIFLLWVVSSGHALAAGAWSRKGPATAVLHTGPTGACSPQGRTYYIDGLYGDDTNEGTSVNSAWRHIARLAKCCLQPGDRVLLRRGTVFHERADIQAKGTAAQPVLIGAYGRGAKPLIVAPDSSLYTVQVKNSDYVTLQELEIVNKGSGRLAGRTGVKLLCSEYGVSHRLTLKNLYIHDVNGSLIKAKGGGSGILIENRWKNKVSVFDSLLIENCVIRRTSRNGIIWQAPYRRDDWHPSTHVVVRGNLLEGVPGDGIVPIGCDGARIEYNVMRDCPEILPSSEAAAGIWPWSCDNTCIQFNEVSGQKNQWDAQGFDADYNCRNTLIQYNYSHDNYGGFVLICNDGGAGLPYNIGNRGTIVRYNISINDGIRPRPARSGAMFSPAIHIAGPVRHTLIAHNIIHQNFIASGTGIDRTMLVSDAWNGFSDNTRICKNVFYAPVSSRFCMNGSANNYFSDNYYLGRYDSRPTDSLAHLTDAFYLSQGQSSPLDGFIRLSGLISPREIAGGAASGHFVNKDAILLFLDRMYKP